MDWTLPLVQGELVTRLLNKVLIQAQGRLRIQVQNMFLRSEVRNRIGGRAPKLCCTGCTAPGLFGR